MKKEIVIIGAGINGLMCAYHLAKQGNVEIKIYDQAQIPNPTSASFGKHRLIHPRSSDCWKILTADMYTIFPSLASYLRIR